MKEPIPKAVDFKLIKLENQYALKVYGDGYIPISDYKLQSSANGETELSLTIKGLSNELELKARLNSNSPACRRKEKTMDDLSSNNSTDEAIHLWFESMMKAAGITLHDTPEEQICTHPKQSLQSV